MSRIKITLDGTVLHDGAAPTEEEFAAIRAKITAARGYDEDRYVECDDDCRALTDPQKEARDWERD